MTGSVDDATDGDDGTSGARATIRTEHGDPARDAEQVPARTVAQAIAPDNTDQMSTTVVNDAVETTIRRSDAAGLRSTVDDYLVNLDVAVRMARAARTCGDDTSEPGAEMATGNAGPDGLNKDEDPKPVTETDADPAPTADTNANDNTPTDTATNTDTATDTATDTNTDTNTNTDTDTT